MMPRLLEQVRRAATRSPTELWTRALQQLHVTGERAHLLVRGHSDSDGASIRSRLNSAPSRLAGHFFTGTSDPSSTVAALRQHAPHVERGLLERAVRIDAGEVPVLGHGWLHIGRTPNWHHEPIANITAPRRHWSRIPYLDPAVIGDHKVLWEFNRHQHFVTLGQAWSFTQEDRWVDCFERHAASWLDQNAPRVGVNWASSLEVAYRAISWCWALRLFEGSRLAGGELPARMQVSLRSHARHIERYLSTYFSPNTHLTGEALGLFYLAVCVPELPGASRFRTLAVEVLEQELARQVHADGVYFEQATQYHRYTAEIYLHYFLLTVASGGMPSSALHRSLNGLFDVLLALTRSDGTMPLIGDDDGGRLVQLDAARPDETRALLGAGAVALSRADLANAAGNDVGMSCWLHGSAAIDTLHRLRGKAASHQTSQAFPTGGLYVIRDQADEGRGHAAIDAGPHGALSFGHSHADALSVELFAGDGPLFADAGTCTYVGSERDAFRSTAAHNTVEVDGESACLPGAPFKWRSVADGHADGWLDAAGLTWFRGHHDGYARLPDPVIHGRDVVHPAAGIWVVEDTLRSSSAHTATLRWLLAPGISAHVTDSWNGGGVVGLSRGGAWVASIAIVSIGGSVELRPGKVSPQFGQCEVTTVIAWNGGFERDLTVHSIVIDWTVASASPVSIVPAAGKALLLNGGGSHPSSETNNTRELRLGEEELDHGAALRSRGRVTFTERLENGTTARVCAVGVASLACNGEQLLSSEAASGWFVGTLDGDQWSTTAGILRTAAPAGVMNGTLSSVDH